MENQHGQTEVVVITGSRVDIEPGNPLQFGRCEMRYTNCTQMQRAVRIDLYGVRINQDYLAIGTDQHITLIDVSQHMTMLVDS